MPVAAKMAQFIERSSWIRAMFEAGAKLKAEVGAENVYDFSLGNPILNPPASFNQMVATLASEESPGAHGYMPNQGYPMVRDKVASHLAAKTGLPVAGGDIIMTVGAAGALNIAFKAIMDPGAEVVVPTPYFVEYDFYADNHGGAIKRVPTKDNFDLDVDAVADAIDDKTCAVLINTPNNPSGAVYSEATLKKLAKALTQAGEKRGRPVYLISDEPYRRIVFEGTKVPDLFPIYKNSIVLTSFSKDLSLAGERIGYLAVHPEIADKQTLVAAMVLANRILGYVNAPALMQRVVGELLHHSADLAQYAAKRELICKVLDEAGYDYQKPMGAFYVFPKSPIPDDVEFVRAAQKENLLLVPGSGFMGPGHFRIAFCVADDMIERSAEAFKKARAKF